MAKAKRWFGVKEDVRALGSLAQQKMPAQKIAKQPKRTVGAVWQKALGLGISLNSRS
jgi:hypothetical protein